MKTLLTLLFLVSLALAQAPTNYDKVRPAVTLDAVTDSVLVTGHGYGTAGFQITGTWAGTIQFYSTINGTDWVGAYATNSQSRASDTTTTENGLYYVGTSGARYIKAKFSAYTSGSAVVAAITTDDPITTTSAASGGGGGAEGTVDVLSIAAGNNNIGNVDIVTMPTVTVNSHAVTNAGTFAVQNTAATPAGTNNIGDVDILTIAAGDNNIGNVDIASLPTVTVNAHAVTNAGTFATQVDGAALTSLQLTDNLVLAEDAAHTSTDPGVQALAVRRDANTTLATSDGDYGPLQLDAAGSLKVAITAGAGSGGTSIADDAAFTIGSTSTTPISGVYNSTLDNVNDGDAGALAMTANRSLRVHMVDAAGDAVSVGGGTQYAEDVASADGQIGTLGLAIRKATPANQSGSDGDLEPMQVSAGRLWVDASGKTLTVDGSGVTQPVSGTITANAGTGTMAVSLASVPSHAVTNAGTFAVQNTAATPAGTNNIGDVDILTIAAGNNNIGDVDVASVAGTVTVGGVAAHDAAISGAPVRLAARAVTADYTAVAGGDVADLISTVDGKQVVKPHAIRASTWTYAAASGGLVNTTAATMKAAAAAGIRNCLTGIQVINGHATVSTEVLVRDGAAGTVLHRGWAQAAGGGFAATFDVALCGTAATLMEVVNVTTGSAVYVNAQGYISAD